MRLEPLPHHCHALDLSKDAQAQGSEHLSRQQNHVLSDAQPKRRRRLADEFTTRPEAKRLWKTDGETALTTRPTQESDPRVAFPSRMAVNVLFL